MQKDWSTYRITLLLYLGILILPFGFYTIHNAFEKIEKDAYTLIQLHKNHANILQVSQMQNTTKRSVLIKKIEENFTHIKPWFNANEKNEFYVGGKSLTQDFTQVTTSWEKIHKTLDTTPQTDNIIKYSEKMRPLIFSVGKMVLLAKAKVYNLLYITTISIAILFLLLIYLVRAYIHIQIKKHAIHDHETNLFNKKYFLAELKTSCARALRHDYPLSLLSIKINNFETENYDKKTRENVLLMLGGLLTALTRSSDVASRYDKNYFSILLTDTQEKNALFLEQRIREAFKKHDFDVNPKLEFKFLTTHFTSADTAETFLARSQEL